MPNNTLVRNVTTLLRERLPANWSCELAAPSRRGNRGDSALKLMTASGERGTMEILIRRQMDPRDARVLIEQNAVRDSNILLVSRYLSPSTRAELTRGGVSYLDTTGNMRIVLNRPGLFIETQGAASDPSPMLHPVRSLVGPKSGQIVRELVDRRALPGVRELAAATGVDAGYVSRILSFLDREAVVTRDDGGRLRSVDWRGLLTRWANEAPLTSRGWITTWLDPRGLDAFVARLPKINMRYAATGSLAAASYAPMAPIGLAQIWVDDSAAFAERMSLLQTDAGANVMLIEPAVASVFERAVTRNGISYAAPSQVAADLMTSPGRGPSEGEALIEWMMSHESDWRIA